MNTILNRLGLFACLMLLNLSASQASVQAPDELLKSTTHDMFVAMNSEREALRSNPNRVKELVETILLPHVDIITASKWVMGKYWRTASQEQKVGFIREFRTLLVRFYSSALAEYLDTSKEVLDENIIHYFPLRNAAEDKDVTVRAEVRPKTGAPVPINYSMHLTDKGWKVYDVSVEGVSVITTYKNNFANEIKQKGIDGLIASIAERNQELLVKNLKQADNK